jgi:hypothetical protein
VVVSPACLLGFGAVTDGELMEQVRELRARGCSPKVIARQLGVPQSAVAPLIKKIAAAGHVEIGERPVAGCWISPGWSAHLTVNGHAEWPDEAADTGKEGMVIVLVAREQGVGRKLSVCGYLVDVFCLGLKNTNGPDLKSDSELIEYRHAFFSRYDGDPLEVPLELARHLVFGAVDYARGLGFEPHVDFAATSGHLGVWTGGSDIEFGRDGKPFYAQGPYDNARSVMRTLERTAGAGNFDFLGVTPLAR